ncbi:MAG TPA: hypothetical protein VEI57_10100 [Nitrospirota bacterium]|nr:hypothetical protein [Nitrospirota bacterium]
MSRSPPTLTSSFSPKVHGLVSSLGDQKRAVVFMDAFDNLGGTVSEAGASLLYISKLSVKTSAMLRFASIR